MAFLKWNKQDSSDDNMDYDIQSLLSELEAASYIADKRSISKDLLDAVKADPVNASDICLPTLLPILGEYANDSEMCQNLLDLLSVLVNENNFKNNKEILSINVESIFKYKDSIRILFEQLDNDNMYVKLVVIDILRSSLTVNTSLVGECINQSPLALQKLVDCLNDNREEIRNDLLLILLLLVEKFSDIANFIAFQDGLDMLFRILNKETGVIARDCIRVIYSIIHQNLVTMKLLSQFQYLNKISSFININQLYNQSISNTHCIDFSIYPTILSRSAGVSMDLLQYSLLIIEELTDLTLLPPSQTNDSSSILIIKNNIKLLSKCDNITFGLLSIALFNQFVFIYQSSNRPIPAEPQIIESFQKLADRCQALFLRYAKFLSSIETLEELTILFDDNSSSLFSFLLQNVFNYPANHYNNELLFQCIIQNPAVDYSIINSENATGKYLIQVFVKSLSMANPRGMINHSFITTTSIYLHCCRNDPTCFEALSIQNQKSTLFILRYILTNLQTISLGILARLVYLIITIVELHAGYVMQILQDIPLLIDFMTLMTTEIDKNQPDFGMKISMIALLFICFVVHNQDPTFDLLTLLEKNVGLSHVTSFALLLIHHSAVNELKTNDDGDVEEESVIYSREFIDESNSQYYVFKQKLTEYYLTLDTGSKESVDSNLIKGLKDVLRVQDQEIKQLRIQVSTGGNEETMNWAQIAEEHEEELASLQQRYDDLVLESSTLREQYSQAMKRVEEVEELLVAKKGMEDDNALMERIALLEETVHSLQSENTQLRNSSLTSSTQENDSLSKSTNGDLEVKITILETQVKEMEQKQEDKEKEMEHLMEEIKGFEDQMNQLKQEIMDKDVQIEKLKKEKEGIKEKCDSSKDEIVRMEIELSDSRASLLKLQEDYAVSQHELKQVLLCVQQYYVECEVLKKGVVQLGGEEVLEKLISSSKEAVTRLYTTKPSEL